MAKFISIHSHEELKGSFVHVRKPGKYVAVDLPDAQVSIGPVKVGKIKETYRSWTQTKRFYAAAFSWLHPEQPRAVAELGNLQVAVGLDHLPREVFCRTLVGHCRDMMRDAPQLRRWGESRLALLEYVLPPRPILPTILTDVQSALNSELLAAACSMGVDSPKARQIASEVSVLALRSAAQAVAHVLGKEGPTCHLNANLMVVVPSGAAGGPKYRPHATAIENAKKAAKLWEGERWTQCLVIVAETVDNKAIEAEHVGFWTPLIKKVNGESLPGAPSAFAKMAGNAVFKDDLPPMSAFDSVIAVRWRAFVEEHIEERLFVSLPLLVPNRQVRSPIAVLNVNADPPEDHPWCRAHHPEWLALATESCTPFVAIAFRAVQIMMAIDGNTENAKLQLGVDRWSTLPGFNSQLHLPGGIQDGGNDETSRLALPAPNEVAGEGEGNATRP